MFRTPNSFRGTMYSILGSVLLDLKFSTGLITTILHAHTRKQDAHVCKNEKPSDTFS
jgi:hypothetical protein